MTCNTCVWWRPLTEAPTDDNGNPVYGTCNAMPPRPTLFAVADVDEWHTRTLATVWPRTKADDHCGAHIGRDLIDPATGRFKVPVTPPGYDEGDETMQ